MGWKDWSYWLKGGIVSLLIVLILFIVAGVINIISPGGEWGGWSIVLGFLYFASLPLYWIFGIQRPEGIIYWIINFIVLPIIFYFIIGAIIGFIIGKIKNRK